MPAPTLWFFFGIICTQTQAADCTRVVFDSPRATFYDTGAPALPPRFASSGECMRAMSRKYDRVKPLVVAGSQWTEFGCTKGKPS
jgi:hypothetical protein